MCSINYHQINQAIPSKQVVFRQPKSSILDQIGNSKVKALIERWENQKELQSSRGYLSANRSCQAKVIDSDRDRSTLQVKPGIALDQATIISPEPSHPYDRRISSPKREPRENPQHVVFQIRDDSEAPKSQARRFPVDENRGILSPIQLESKEILQEKVKKFYRQLKGNERLNPQDYRDGIYRIYRLSQLGIEQLAFENVNHKKILRWPFKQNAFKNTMINFASFFKKIASKKSGRQVLQERKTQEILADYVKERGEVLQEGGLFGKGVREVLEQNWEEIRAQPKEAGKFLVKISNHSLLNNICQDASTNVKNVLIWRFKEAEANGKEKEFFQDPENFKLAGLSRLNELSRPTGDSRIPKLNALELDEKQRDALYYFLREIYTTEKSFHESMTEMNPMVTLETKKTEDRQRFRFRRRETTSETMKLFEALEKVGGITSEERKSWEEGLEDLVKYSDFFKNQLELLDDKEIPEQKKLEVLLSTFSQNSFSYYVDIIGRVAINYSKNLRILDKLEKKAEKDQKLRNLLQQYGESLFGQKNLLVKLQSNLIMPVQRAPRHLLLYREVMKSMKNVPLSPEIEEALQRNMEDIEKAVGAFDRAMLGNQ
ncbi:MAG: RhoGEF domain-containing protein [Waddliaceae bacterium]